MKQVSCFGTGQNKLLFDPLGIKGNGIRESGVIGLEEEILSLHVWGALLPKTGVGGHVGFRAQRFVLYFFRSNGEAGLRV